MNAQTSPRTFAPFHVRDRSFYALFVALCWVGVLFGFYPASSARFSGRADYPAPTILVIHALLFSTWMFVLTAQVAFVRTKRLRIHRKFGRAGFLLVPLMVYTALAAELFSQRFYIRRHNDDLHFFILPIFYATSFGVLAGWALASAQKDPAAHKRLILLATTIIAGAAYARWWGDALTRLYGDGFWGTVINTFAGTNMLLALIVGYDIATRGTPHRIFLIVVPAVLAAELACSYIYHAEWWMPIARQLIEIRLPPSR